MNVPCLNVKFVPTHKVVANDYNPNEVDRPEMELLIHSIREDGLTQAPVVFYDREQDIYVVLDGFHRYKILRDYFKCNYIPIVVIDRPIQDRMAATIRHNRARGKHQAGIMESLVRKLSVNWSDVQIAKQLGMRAEEVLRYKQEMGIAEYYKYRQYSRAWVWVDVGGEGEEIVN